jgi:hypothetical protein
MNIFVCVFFFLNIIYICIYYTTQIPLKSGANSGALEGLAVPAPHVTPIVSLLNDTKLG